MFIDVSNPLNEKVLRYLSRGSKGKKLVSSTPDSVEDPYVKQGSHPEIVERVWDQLGASLPMDCRCLIYGTPSLVHPKNGIILVFCCGTQYCMRLMPADFKEAIVKGAKTHTKWISGGEMDVTSELGGDWIFGFWNELETKWCCNTYESI